MWQLLTLALFPTLADPYPAARSATWEKEVAGIEARTKASPPKAGGVVFVGSSSFRLWDTAKAFPELNTVNVAFGGSEMRDTVHFYARLVVPLKASRVVIYAGDNDIAAKRTPEQIRDDYLALVKLIHAQDAKTLIDYTAIKPSPSRWKLYAEQTQANKLIQVEIAKDARLKYLDIVPLLLGDNGEPKPELYVADKLHLSPAGYKLWEAYFRKAWAVPVEHTKDTLDDVKKALAAKTAVLIDVRELKEWDAGHLEDAKLLPLSAINKGLPEKELEMKLPSGKIIYLHCKAGGRCLLAAEALKAQGYDLRPLALGYADLLKAGFEKAK
jgi:rhodanese-related sulfurtransferase/lysophospholipase L1-like esterase